MKRHLLFLVLFAKIVASAFAAPTAKAIYCAENTTLYFTYDEVTYSTGSTFEGNTITKVYTNLRTDGYGNVSTSKAPWCADYGTVITAVKFMDGFSSWQPTSLQYFFYAMSALETIEGEGNLNLSSVTSMRYMCYNCQKLDCIDAFSSGNVDNLESLEYAFGYCNLKNLNALSNWKEHTGKITNMNSAFYSNGGLEDISALTDWDTSSLTGLSSMLSFTAITNVDALLNWDVSGVTSFNGLFWSCDQLESIEGLKNWITSSATYMEQTFFCCEKINDIQWLSNWDLSSTTEITCMFYKCKSISDFSPLSVWDVSNVINMQETFGDCDGLTNLDAFANWDVSKVEHLGGTFGLCDNLTNIDALANWKDKTTNVLCMRQIFYKDEKLEDVSPVYEWNTSSVSSMYGAFAGCKSLTGIIDLSKWDLSSLGIGGLAGGDSYTHGMAEIFKDCIGITGVIMGCGNIGGKFLSVERGGKIIGTLRDRMFENCPKLRFVDFSGCTDTYGNITSVDPDYTETVTYKVGSREMTATLYDTFYGVPRTTVKYLPKDNTQPTEGVLENVVYTATDGTLQCDKYYSEDKVDIELPHRFHADAATYERTFNSNYGGVILPYPVKINDTDDEEFQPFLLKKEYTNAMYFEGKTEVDANTPFVFKRKGGTSMTFPMSDVWVESTYDVDGQTTNNIELDAWNAQGFYTTHEIEPENGKFGIPTKDDYKETSIVEYDYDRVYYIAGNKFYRADNSTLYLDPHRIVFYGMWDKYTGGDSSAKPYVYDIEEMDSQVVTAIEEAEVRMDEENAVEIYDASGNRLSKTQRGLNILRMSDGSIKKVIKK